MFKGMSLSTRLYSGFFAVLVIVTALGTFAYTRLVSIDEHSSFITTDCMPGIYIAEEIQTRAQELLLLPAKHIFSHDKAEMDAIEEKTMKIKGEIDSLMKRYEGTIHEPEDRELFGKIGPARERFIAIRNQIVLPASRAGKKEEAQMAFAKQLEPLTSSIRRPAKRSSITIKRTATKPKS